MFVTAFWVVVSGFGLVHHGCTALKIRMEFWNPGTWNCYCCWPVTAVGLVNFLRDISSVSDVLSYTHTHTRRTYIYMYILRVSCQTWSYLPGPKDDEVTLCMTVQVHTEGIRFKVDTTASSPTASARFKAVNGWYRCYLASQWCAEMGPRDLHSLLWNLIFFQGTADMVVHLQLETSWYWANWLSKSQSHCAMFVTVFTSYFLLECLREGCHGPASAFNSFICSLHQFPNMT